MSMDTEKHQLSAFFVRIQELSGVEKLSSNDYQLLVRFLYQTLRMGKITVGTTATVRNIISEDGPTKSYLRLPDLNLRKANRFVTLLLDDFSIDSADSQTKKSLGGYIFFVVLASLSGIFIPDELSDPEIYYHFDRETTELILKNIHIFGQPDVLNQIIDNNIKKIIVTIINQGLQLYPNAALRHSLSQSEDNLIGYDLLSLVAPEISSRLNIKIEHKSLTTINSKHSRLNSGEFFLSKAIQKVMSSDEDVCIWQIISELFIIVNNSDDLSEEEKDQYFSFSNIVAMFVTIITIHDELPQRGRNSDLEMTVELFDELNYLYEQKFLKLGNQNKRLQKFLSNIDDHREQFLLRKENQKRIRARTLSREVFRVLTRDQRTKIESKYQSKKTEIYEYMSKKPEFDDYFPNFFENFLQTELNTLDSIEKLLKTTFEFRVKIDDDEFVLSDVFTEEFPQYEENVNAIKTKLKELTKVWKNKKKILKIVSEYIGLVKKVAVYNPDWFESKTTLVQSLRVALGDIDFDDDVFTGRLDGSEREVEKMPPSKPFLQELDGVTAEHEDVAVAFTLNPISQVKVISAQNQKIKSALSDILAWEQKVDELEKRVQKLQRFLKEKQEIIESIVIDPREFGLRINYAYTTAMHLRASETKRFAAVELSSIRENPTGFRAMMLSAIESATKTINPGYHSIFPNKVPMPSWASDKEARDRDVKLRILGHLEDIYAGNPLYGLLDETVQAQLFMILPTIPVMPHSITCGDCQFLKRKKKRTRKPEPDEPRRFRTTNLVPPLFHIEHAPESPFFQYTLPLEVIEKLDDDLREGGANVGAEVFIDHAVARLLLAGLLDEYTDSAHYLAESEVVPAVDVDCLVFGGNVGHAAKVVAGKKGRTKFAGGVMQSFLMEAQYAFLVNSLRSFGASMRAHDLVNSVGCMLQGLHCFSHVPDDIRGEWSDSTVEFNLILAAFHSFQQSRALGFLLQTYRDETNEMMITFKPIDLFGALFQLVETGGGVKVQSRSGVKEKNVILFSDLSAAFPKESSLAIWHLLRTWLDMVLYKGGVIFPTRLARQQLDKNNGFGDITVEQAKKLALEGYAEFAKKAREIIDQKDTIIESLGDYSRGDMQMELRYFAKKIMAKDPYLFLVLCSDEDVVSDEWFAHGVGLRKLFPTFDALYQDQKLWKILLKNVKKITNTDEPEPELLIAQILFEIPQARELISQYIEASLFCGDREQMYLVADRLTKNRTHYGENKGKAGNWGILSIRLFTLARMRKSWNRFANLLHEITEESNFVIGNPEEWKCFQDIQERLRKTHKSNSTSSKFRQGVKPLFSKANEYSEPHKKELLDLSRLPAILLIKHAILDSPTLETRKNSFQEALQLRFYLFEKGFFDQEELYNYNNMNTFRAFRKEFNQKNKSQLFNDMIKISESVDEARKLYESGTDLNQCVDSVLKVFIAKLSNSRFEAKDVYERVPMFEDGSPRGYIAYPSGEVLRILADLLLSDMDLIGGVNEYLKE